jgi:DNA-binding transcriptional LysR family regulator
MSTVTQLRAFDAVARAGSVQEAARELFVTQPSVSAAVAALARSLGVALVERDGRGIRLTKAGEAFAPYVAEVLGLLEQGGRAAAEAAHPERARLRVVAVNTAGEYLLPPLIQGYRERHPDVEVLLEIGNRRTVVERVESRQADVGIGGRPRGRELEGRPFTENELVIVGRDMPDDLARATWLLREPGSGTREATETFLAERGIDAAEVLTLGSNGAVKQALALGLGVTLISVHAVARELEAGVLVRIPAVGTPLVRPWYALVARGVPPRPAVVGFVEYLHSAAGRDALARAL